MYTILAVKIGPDYPASPFHEGYSAGREGGGGEGATRFYWWNEDRARCSSGEGEKESLSFSLSYPRDPSRFLSKGTISVFKDSSVHCTVVGSSFASVLAHVSSDSHFLRSTPARYFPLSARRVTTPCGYTIRIVTVPPLHGSVISMASPKQRHHRRRLTRRRCE